MTSGSDRNPALRDVAGLYSASLAEHGLIPQGVGWGDDESHRLRAALCADVRELGYTLASYVSPRATTFPTLEVGANVFIFENNTVQPYASLGDDVVLWSGNHIGHHSVIGDHCFVTSHVVVSGNVRVGPYCYLGINASIRDGIEIGEGCVIGAGAVVMRTTGEREVYLGPRAERDERTSDDLRL